MNCERVCVCRMGKICMTNLMVISKTESKDSAVFQSDRFYLAILIYFFFSSDIHSCILCVRSVLNAHMQKDRARETQGGRKSVCVLFCIISAIQLIWLIFVQSVCVCVRVWIMINVNLSIKIANIECYINRLFGISMLKQPHSLISF